MKRGTFVPGAPKEHYVFNQFRRVAQPNRRVVVQFEVSESYPGERFLAEFILSPTEGLGTTSKYRSYHLELFGMLTVNSVRDLSLNEPLSIEAVPGQSNHLTIWQI